jgi:hypothetical protein
MDYKVVGTLRSGWALVLWLVVSDSPYDHVRISLLVSRKRHDLAGTEQRRYGT